MKAGDKHYRAWVGPPVAYGISAMRQICLVAALGLKEEDYFLDIGCGSLRFGRMLIPYLHAGRYHGLEPEEWVVKEGIEQELSQGIIDLKKPKFNHNRDFNLSVFEQKFDFMWAQSVFSHASLKQIKKCLNETKVVLADNGIFVFNVGFGRTDYQGEEWVYPGVVSYTYRLIAETINATGLKHRLLIDPLNRKPHKWMVVALEEGRLEEFSEFTCQPKELVQGRNKTCTVVEFNSMGWGQRRDF